MSINLGEPFLDTKQILKEVEEIESMIESYQEDIDAAKDEFNEAENDDDRKKAQEDIEKAQAWIDDYNEELKPLKEFVEEYEDQISDFMHGATLIEDSAFVDYAKDYATDIVLPHSFNNWPFNHIDWNEAADEFQLSFMDVEIGDYTYWVMD